MQNWALRGGGKSYNFYCIFDEGVKNVTKMRKLYSVAADLARLLEGSHFDCLLGVGPIGSELETNTWHLAVLPDESSIEKRSNELVTLLYGFLQHLQIQQQQPHLPQSAEVETSEEKKLLN